MAVLYPVDREQGKRICLEQVLVGIGVPHYATSQSSIRSSIELRSPGGIAIEETTHQVFVTTRYSGVLVFSETGEFLYLLGAGQLSLSYGITIHGDNVYVSCMDDAVCKLSLINMRLVKKIGCYGTDNGQFRTLGQLTTDATGRIFITDKGNNRICIHDPDLNHLGNITHHSIFGPSDVKVSRDHLYVLCVNKSPCIIVLTLEGDMLHSLITCGEGMDVLFPLFFCFDPFYNFVFSDYKSDSIRIFSSEGKFLHKIGKGHNQQMFYQPRGLVVTSNGRLICVSDDEKCCLQIFC